ncbi:hypothetical protein PN441_07940 [Spirulina major CS-329]|uniref:hypothetical protein n=1 Tax=Spirulina TaxID=1154 RepID=UPI00232FD12D|nr:MULTISPECIES: hypothetical protein [Spirulina]MDB9495219.1 hypothetical protein [Spirulina subsalsa CS-330]MDB9503001.1 hypothetical protein [Spirulina major CS-329]
MPTFQQHWQDQGSLPTFQERDRAMLKRELQEAVMSLRRSQVGTGARSELF